jgi:YesN/AraC family two-component response regulator
MDQEKSILIVDDEIDLLSQLNMFLTYEKYRVFTASNGADGLESFKKNSTPICLIDYKMPGMDGLQLLHEIKAIAPATEVILISGHADMKIAVKAIKDQAFDFLPKPVDLYELLGKLDEVWANIESKKILRDVKISGSLVSKKLDRSIPITELTLTMNLDEIGSPKFTKDLDQLIINGHLEKNVIFAMGRVNHINNIGLNALVDGYEKLTQMEYQVILSNINTALYSYLHMLGYDTYFSILKTTEFPEKAFLGNL